MLKKAKKDTLIFFLISGGGSAMFDLPLDPQIGLRGHNRLPQALLASGAPINEINTLRKHFSAVKGGRLAIAAPEATKVSLAAAGCAAADAGCAVVGADVAGPLDGERSAQVLTKYDLAAKFPTAVRAFFERADLPESPGNKGIGGRRFFPSCSGRGRRRRARLPRRRR